jgi:hypothetical protein
VWQFLFALRKSAIGGASPYEEAFQMTAREFDQQFETATRTVRGASAFGIYPLNCYRRLSHENAWETRAR